MRTIPLSVALLFVALSVGAQQRVRLGASGAEKVMNLTKSDGTTEQTRVADLSQISFLTASDGGQGLIVTTLAGETAAVRFDDSPVVTISSGRLTVKSTSAETMKFQIDDIAEITFGDATGGTGISEPEGFSMLLQGRGALFRGIPEGTQPHVYSLDGRQLPAPPVVDGELQLSRETLGSGIFIVKVGSFATKVQF